MPLSLNSPGELGDVSAHLRSYTWGNVLQLEQPGRELLNRLARRAPLLPGSVIAPPHMLRIQSM
jgi:hypothetical protein